MRKQVKIKMNNDTKKLGIPIIEKKINLMTPNYLPRKVSLINLKEKISPKKGNFLIYDSKQNISSNTNNVNQPINGDDHCCGNDIPILNADLQLWTKEESHQS